MTQSLKLAGGPILQPLRISWEPNRNENFNDLARHELAGPGCAPLPPNRNEEIVLALILGFVLVAMLVIMLGTFS